MILLDSNVIVAHLRGVPAARTWLIEARRRTGRLATSTVTLTEAAAGMRSGERRDVMRLLSTFDVFPVTERVGWRAAELMRQFRRSHSGIGLGDYLIGAVADVNGLQLATLNVRHFPMFTGLVPPFAVG